MRVVRNRQPLKQETKDKIAAALRGRKASEETRAKMSKSRTGVKKPNPGNIGNTNGVGRKDSPEAIEKKRSEWLGENNPNWQGGQTRETLLARSCAEYSEWRNAVYIRDNWTCRACERKGVYLHAHHVKGFAKYPEHRYEVDNGITLCKKCHYFLHGLLKEWNGDTQLEYAENKNKSQEGYDDACASGVCAL